MQKPILPQVPLEDCRDGLLGELSKLAGGGGALGGNSWKVSVRTTKGYESRLAGHGPRLAQVEQD
eukprot:6110157-Pyramimonas_sp.AAC.1